MKRRPHAFAWALVGVWAIVAATANLLAWTNRPATTDLRQLDSMDLAFVIALTVYTLAFVATGAMVVLRAGHLIGWLLLASGIALLVPLAGEQYALRGFVVMPGSVPGVEFAAMASYAAFTLLWYTPPAVILLLFPTGRPRSRRWRPVVVAAPLGALIVTLADLLRPGLVDTDWTDYPVTFRNPFGIEGTTAAMEAISTIGTTVTLGLLLSGVVSVVLRFRASHAVERQQIKWLVLVALATALIIVGIIAANIVASGTTSEDTVGSVGWGVVVTTLLLGLPLSIGAGVLRYRLYDIDRIVSRTLSYAILTGLLAGTFTLIVLVPVAVLGTGERPDWLIATGTLSVAALFRPIRRHVQNAVDHRFNRARYDAEHTIDAFTRRLREQIDLDALGAELEAIVERTMQPQEVTLWLTRRTA